MLLGTYHLAGSSGDGISHGLDDVLPPRRQEELETLVERLARWSPDQVAVEWPFSFADSTLARYERYRAGTLAPSRNEVVQVGFRLAARLGHPRVDPIDHPMPIGNDSTAPLWARRPELRRSRDSLLLAARPAANAQAERRRTTSVVEHLREENGDAALHAGNSLTMFGGYLGAGDGDNYAGPLLLARWYERNFRMAHHLTRVLRPGTKRVLLLVGAGHVPPLRNILDEAPQFCPVSPLPLLR